jgi:hypothetical protein
MTWAEFRALLLVEQFGTPTPQWHPTAKYRAAAWERVRRIEEDMYEQERAS